MRPFALLLALAALLAPAILYGQPVPVRALHLSDPGDHGPGLVLDFAPMAAPLPGGGFAVAWQADFQGPFFESWTTSCVVRRFGAAGEPGPGNGIAHGLVVNDNFPESPAVAADGAGGLVAAWHVVLYAEAEVYVQRFAPDGTPRGEPAVIGEPREGHCAWTPAVAASASGRYAVAWEEAARGCDAAATVVGVQAFDAAGTPATPVLRLAPSRPGATLSKPRLAIDGRGRFTVAWLERPGSDGGPAVVRVQRFGRGGWTLGPRLALDLAGEVAFLADGGFAVAGLEATPEGQRLRLRRFTAEGAPLGPAVDAGAGPGAAPQTLTADGRGNLALLWLAGETLRLRLFNRALVPQGAAVEVGTAHMSLWAPRYGSLAFGRSGRLLAAWPGPREEPAPGMGWVPLLGRLWQARRDADLCLRRGGSFRCDTANDGGAAEEALAFGVPRPGDVPLLADADGDGRADPCLARGRRFLCDAAHDGGAAELRTPVFGLPGDLPLLGDVDGDGRADPCAWRRGTLLCDRARDGGAEDLRVAFGTAADLPLLGDVDGDGRADLCVARAGLFLCDTGHDGGRAELRLSLRRLAGDLAGGAPLLGDVDGDGRADPCLYGGGRLLCGLFSQAGGRPQLLELALAGEPGDVPVLGDVDAF